MVESVDHRQPYTAPVHGPEPDPAYDAKAAEWRAKLEKWQTSTQPAE